MRTLNRIYAWLFGYFWLPCPVCGKMYGGHEIVNVWTAALMKDGHAYCVCPNPQCSYEAAVLNAAHGHTQFVRADSSVTDAIARRMVAEYDAVLCGDPTATRTDGMRAALEAALATQEGRNG